MNVVNNLKVGMKVIVVLIFMIVMLVSIATIGIRNVNNVNNGVASMYKDRALPTNQLGHAYASFCNMRGDVCTWVLLPNKRDAIKHDIETDIAKVETDMAAYRTSHMTQADQEENARFDVAWRTLKQETLGIIAGNGSGEQKALQAIAEGGSFYIARATVAKTLDKLLENIRLRMVDANKQSNATYTNATQVLVVVCILTVCVSFMLAFVFTRSMVDPLANMTDVAQKVSAGDLSVNVPTETRDDEVGVLARAFQQMLGNLRNSTISLSEGQRLMEELRTASLYTRNLIEASIDPMVIINADGKITDVNTTTEQVTGVTRARLIGSNFTDYFTEPQRAQEGYQQIFARGAIRDYPLTIRHVSGSTMDVLYNASVYKNEAGEVQGAFATARDITARNQMDEELKNYRAQLEETVESRTTVLREVKETANVLASASAEILTATTQVATGAQEASTAISETTTNVEEVRQAARLSSDKAKDVSDNAQRVDQVAQTGQQAVEETAAGMQHIRDQMESIAQTIIRLSEQSQSIGGIIAAVTDLADQSNLLAVNAAIEAARAGEHGKGFAVVAQEIKSLAEQSKQATTQVRGILSDVQKATSAAVMATEQGSKAVEAGVQQTAQASDAIRTLAENAGIAAQVATQIVASSQQQVVGMEQIGLAMENITQTSAQTAVSMQQAESAARNLHELGQRLKELVAQSTS